MKIGKLKVSVIVPVYNVENYLNECLDSLVKQTLDGIEIILINDGSTDNSQNIINMYLKKYPNLIRTYKQKNAGLSAARNAGIKKAKGEYISFIDSDDYVRKDMLQKMYERAKNDESDIVVCKFIKIFKKQCILSDEKFPKTGIFNVRTDPSLLEIAKSYACNKIFKRNLFTKSKIEFPVGQVFEDSAIVYNLMLIAKNISFVNEGLYYYRKSVKESLSKSVDKRIYDIFKSLDNFIEFYKINGVFDQNYFDIINICVMHIMRRLKVIETSKQSLEREKSVNEAYSYLNKKCKGWEKTGYAKRNIKKSPYLSSAFRLNFHLKYGIKINENKYVLLFQKAYTKIVKKMKKKIKRILKKIVPSFYAKKEIRTIKKYIAPDYLDKLEKIQKYGYEILCEVGKLCDKHNIKYYLSEGTLLGAVRHQGFIPWDDDIDIMMPREEYERFLQVAMKELPKGYVLQCSKNINKYWVSSAKVRMTKKTEFVQDELLAVTPYVGPYIDVFPLDYFPKKDSFMQRRYMKKVKDLRNILWYKSSQKKSRDLKGIRNKLMCLCKNLYRIEGIHKKLYSAMTKFNKKSHNYIINYGSYYDFKKQIFPYEYYGIPRYIKFRDKQFPIPNSAEKILTQIYGDYNRLPNIMNRIPKHSFFKTEKDLNSRKKLLLVVDIDNWAFFNIAKNIMKELAVEYDIKIVSMITEKLSLKALFKKYKDYDCYHFFWRKLLFDLDKLDKKTIKKYVLNKIITTSVYDHLYLEDRYAKMKNMSKYIKSYTVSSNKLYDIYKNIEGLKKPAAVITDGVDLSKFYPKNMERFDNLDRPLVIGWVGNSLWAKNKNDLKGVNTILKPAIKELQKEGYNIVELFADRVNGFIAHDQMVDYYSKIDILVCSSMNEGTPNPVLEAMACGTVIVSTNVGIVPDVLGKKQKKYILSEHSKNCMKKVLRNMIKNKESMRELSQENIERIKCWSWELKCQDFKKYFDDVISRNRK